MIYIRHWKQQAWVSISAMWLQVLMSVSRCMLQHSIWPLVVRFNILVTQNASHLIYQMANKIIGLIGLEWINLYTRKTPRGVSNLHALNDEWCLQASWPLCTGYALKHNTIAAVATCVITNRLTAIYLTTYYSSCSFERFLFGLFVEAPPHPLPGK